METVSYIVQEVAAFGLSTEELPEAIVKEFEVSVDVTATESQV